MVPALLATMLHPHPPSHSSPLVTLHFVYTHTYTAPLAVAVSYTHLDVYKRQGRTFTYQHTALLPANAASLTAVTIQPISEGVDSHKLPNHLQENALYYSQAVWMKMNGPSLISMLDGYTFQGHPLADLLDPQPLATIGNYLAFRFYQEDEQWTRFLRDHGIKLGTKQEDCLLYTSRCV